MKRGAWLLAWAFAVAPALAGATLDRDAARAAGMDAYVVALKAPPYRLAALHGGERDNRDYRGRVVLLNFWASWCPPCREEFPSLERLQRSLGGADFTVLAVAVADSEPGIRRFLGGKPPPFDVLLDDDRKTASAYRAAGVPVTYLLDREGRILAGKAGPQLWDSAQMQQLIRQAIDSTR